MLENLSYSPRLDGANWRCQSDLCFYLVVVILLHVLLDGLLPGLGAVMLILVGLLFLYTNSLHRSYLPGRTQRHELIECVVYKAIVQHTKKDKAIFEKAFLG